MFKVLHKVERRLLPNCPSGSYLGKPVFRSGHFISINSNKFIIFGFFFSGQNVEEAFLETAKKIYQSIQDGRLDLNAAESGVQHKPASPGRPLAAPPAARDNCAC